MSFFEIFINFQTGVTGSWKLHFFFPFWQLYTREPPAGFHNEMHLWYLWLERERKENRGKANNNTSEQIIWELIFDGKIYESFDFI